MNAASSGRERVLHEARRFFLERGYAEVSMQQIADAVGMTKAALYYHFRDKDDLFAQVVVREMTLQRESIERQIEAGGTLSELTEHIARLYLERLSPDSLRMMLDFKDRVPEDRHQEVHEELDRFTKSLTVLFERAAERGEIRDLPPRLAAFLFFHTLVGFVIDSVRDPSLLATSGEESTAALISSVVLHGIAAPNGSSRTSTGTLQSAHATAAGGDTD